MNEYNWVCLTKTG